MLNIPNFLEGLPLWLDLIIRVFIAGVCGFIIGFERKTRSKEAGIRTHTILAIGAALFMIVSKYAFGDLWTGSGWNGVSGADASRVVSQAVTGIGFLGGGVIVYTKGSLHGLTTAAGIWATAGVGMLVGSGVGALMVLGIVVALVIVGIHTFFRLPIKAFRARTFHTVTIEFNLVEGALDRIKGIFSTCKVVQMKLTERDAEGKNVLGKVIIRTADNMNDNKWKETLDSIDFITSIEYNEEEI